MRDANWIELDRLVEDAMKCWAIPGLAIAGYIVAGMVAERLSGQSWEQFTTQRLLSPLGFRKFGFSTDTLVSAANFARPHVREGRHARRTRVWPMHATPAGGIHTCAADMARWLRLRYCGDASTVRKSFRKRQ